MTRTYRVFLGAPTRSFLLQNSLENATYEWRTVEGAIVAAATSGDPTVGVPVNSGNTNTTSAANSASGNNNSFLLIPHETYEAASFRISEFYQNTIFHDNNDHDHDGNGEIRSNPDVASDNNQTTVFTWPPTVASTTGASAAGGAEISAHNYPSFLLHDDDNSKTVPHWDQIETLRSSPSSPSSSKEDESSYSRASRTSLSYSIAQFPLFNFNPNALSSLSHLVTKAQKKLNLLLVAILDVDPRSGTDMVKIRNGADAGKEVPVLRIIVGDEEGRVAKLTAWRDVAEVWAGIPEGTTENEGQAVKRGDVVLIENVNGSKDAQSSPALTASPYLRSRLTICYRTLPRQDGDQKWRPDLRLGATDAAVRKVAGVVRWFENMAGL